MSWTVFRRLLGFAATPVVVGAAAGASAGTDTAECEQLHISLHARSIPREPVTLAQFDAAVSTFAENPDLLADLLGDRFQASRNMIDRLVRDEDVWECAWRNLKESNRRAANGAVEESNRTAVKQQWDELCAKYGCAICHDVLTAPVALQCSHSFCHSCVRDLKDRAAVVDQNGYFLAPSAHSTVVIHNCPVCCAALEGTENYVRDFDNLIYGEVEKVPCCEMKTAYLERRNAYFKYEKARRARAGGGEGKSFFSSMELGDADQQAEEEEWYQRVKFDVVPYLMFAVFAFVVVIFHGHRPGGRH